jgi:E3 ubiquitin-protein ligase MYCBP2
MFHALLDDVLYPIRELFEDVRRKALMRLEYEGLNQADEIASPGGRYFKDPAGFAMDRYAYYVCFKCKKVRESANYKYIHLRCHLS